MSDDTNRAGDREMVHAHSYARVALCQRGSLRSYFRVVGCDVLLLLMIHLLARDWLSYLSVVSPVPCSTLQI